MLRWGEVVPLFRFTGGGDDDARLAVLREHIPSHLRRVLSIQPPDPVLRRVHEVGVRVADRVIQHHARLAVDQQR